MGERGENVARYELHTPSSFQGGNTVCGGKKNSASISGCVSRNISGIVRSSTFSCRTRNIAGISQSEARLHFQMALSLPDEGKFAFIEILLFHPWIWDSSMDNYQSRNRACKSCVHIIIIIIIIIVVISIARHLIDKDEHTALYRISQIYR